MASNDFLFDFSEVLEKEWHAIETRRAACQSGRAQAEPSDLECSSAPKTEPPKDLSGLALSGGGIRSASLSLGLVQALDARGLMRAFDYLSTVSGGGYLGGYLSSSASARCLAGESSQPKTAPSNGQEPSQQSTAEAKRLYPDLHEVRSGAKAGQSERVLRFIYGGKYLGKPWQFANKYLIGLLFNLFVIGSGLIFACSSIAYLFRWLDTPTLRNWMAPVNLDSDTDMLFLPFAGLLAMWLVAWIISYWRRKDDAPGAFAQILLYFAAAAFLVGCTLILVNGQTSLNYAAQAIFGQTKITHDGTASSILLTIIAGGLIPFLKPRAILQRGLHPSGWFDKVLFRFSCVCLLVGVPLIGVGYFGMQNIARTAPSPDNNFRPGEIYDWGSFCSLLLSAEETPNASPEESDLQTDDDNWMSSLSRDISDLKGLRNHVRQEQRSFADNFPWYVTKWPHIWRTANTWWPENEQLEDLQKKVCDGVNENVMPSKLVCVALARHVKATDKESAEKQTDSQPQPDSGNAIVASSPASKKESPKTESLLGVIAEPIAADALLESLKALKKKLLDNSAKTLDSETAAATSDALEGVRQAILSFTAFDPQDVKELNQNLLLALRPECFRDINTIHREVVTAGDQATRLKWMGCSGLAFLLGLFVNLNATSLHRFYRNRLAFAYLEQNDGRELTLSDLRTTCVGAPYHLINASLNRFDSRFSGFVKDRPHADPDRRSMVNFLFSRLSCGSSATGYVATKDFESMRQTPLLLSDAVAISGAAIEPMQFDFAPLAWMMTALNLRLGQWLPNPRAQSGRPFKKRAASVARILLDAPRQIENRNFCYVADGGFSENLAILPLLRRRCRFIIGLDAGYDPDLSFEDLTKTIRLASMREGIAIKKLTGDGQPAQELDTAALRKATDGTSHRHWLVATIHYPANGSQPEETGLLVYIKPSFTGDEEAPLLAYRSQHPEFPQDTTAEQLYDDDRVEAYRCLGNHIGEKIIEQLLTARHGGAIARVGAHGIAIDHEAVRRAALADTWSDPAPVTKSMEQIANSLDSLTNRQRDSLRSSDGAARDPLRAIERLAEFSLRLMGESEVNRELFSTIAEEARERAHEVRRAGGEPDTHLVAEQLTRLAEAWEHLAQHPAPQSDPVEPVESAGTPRIVK